MSHFSRTVWMRIGLLAILPVLAIAQWQYGHDSDPHVRLISLSDDGRQVTYMRSRHDWLHHYATGIFGLEERTLVRQSPGEELRHVLPLGDYCDVKISPDGSRFAAATRTGLLTIGDATSGQVIQTKQWSIDRAEVLDLHFSRDGQYLAAQAFLSKRWLLQIMKAETLHVTQDVGSRWTIAWMTRTHRLVGGNMDVSGSDPKLINRRFVSIEGGQLGVSNEVVTDDDLPDMLPFERFSLRWKRDRIAGWEILDRQSKTSRFIPMDASEPAVLTPTKDTLVILKGDEILRIDLVTGKRLPSQRLDAELGNGITLSANGRFMAVHTRSDAIEVWDIAVGERIQKFPQAPRRWRLWATSVIGTIAWCGAWLASGWRQRTTIGVCTDILLASVVGGIGLYLRRLFAGHPDAWDRTSVIGTFAIMFGISLLGAFWLVYGSGRWSWRLPAFLVGFALVWSVPVWIWHRFKLPGGHTPIIGLGMAAFLILVMAVLRRRGFHLRSVTADAQPSEGGRAHQIPLRDLLVIPGAIGLFIVIAKFVERPTNLVPWLVSFGVLRCLCQALIGIVAVHTALSPARAVWRNLAGLIAIAILSVVAPLAFHGARLMPWWCFAATDSAMGLYILLALLLVRRLGWRLEALPK